MQIEIPKSFQLLGHTFTVEMSDKLYIDEGIYGDCDIERKLIRIQSGGPVFRPETKDSKAATIMITDEDVLDTFYHELTHVILYSMGEFKLFSNERFVSLMGRCLMESLKGHQISNDNKK